MAFSAKEEYDQLLIWCRGDAAAADFLRAGFRVTQIADDFVDRDVAEDRIDSNHMLQLLHLCLVDIPSNPFYRQYRAWFAPLLSTSFLMWEATEAWKASETADSRKFAYCWREICEQLIFMTAYLVGGLQHARLVIRDVHRFYHVTHQDDEDFYKWEQKEYANPKQEE